MINLKIKNISYSAASAASVNCLIREPKAPSVRPLDVKFKI